MEREVEKWLDTDEWKIAEKLHNLLCKRGHQMDECWGLNLPYDLKQPKLSDIQVEYLVKAKDLIALMGFEWAEYTIFVLGGIHHNPREWLTSSG